MSTWKRDIASGLVVLLPLGILLFVVNWLYVRIIGLPLISNLNFAQLGVPEGLVPITRILVALALIITLILAVGYLMRTTAGRVFEAMLDDTINRVPGLRVVYNASKLAVETALSGTDDLQQPVKLEVWDGVRMTAFKTGKRTDDGKIVLFLPTAPNITTGYVMEVDADRVEETGEKVEEALTRVLSAGFAESAHQIPVEEENPARTDDETRTTVKTNSTEQSGTD
ncbi:putative membrane protein [Halohasta litchfieldiae]|jgi:uncharacterized membrane protein|uniref:Uncharacterized membrane protein n=1 Tax=Halohasta litchfieldiae TaxID=1073996 RepID=A0A1H6TE85_9EURY|nr:DUF502 domain-containing protein [Halohasta litchfieldiae]ATW88791.1 putative membrane protein [Halohasta litchfieldiae]SEI78311.1 Uncharacterized membrane protein [Halohasta litchfieldiae]